MANVPSQPSAPGVEILTEIFHYSENGIETPSIAEFYTLVASLTGFRKEAAEREVALLKQDGYLTFDSAQSIQSKKAIRCELASRAVSFINAREGSSASCSHVAALRRGENGQPIPLGDFKRQPTEQAVEPDEREAVDLWLVHLREAGGAVAHRDLAAHMVEVLPSVTDAGAAHQLSRHMVSDGLIEHYVYQRVLRGSALPGNMDRLNTLVDEALAETAPAIA